MTILGIQIEFFIILIFSIIDFIFLIVLRSFKKSGLAIYAFSIAVFIVGSLLKNLFLLFLSTSILLIFFFITSYYLYMFFLYKKKHIIFNSYNLQLLHPFKEYEFDFNAVNTPSPFPGIFFLLNYSVYENHDLITINTNPSSYKTKNIVSIFTVFNRHGEFLLKDFYFIFQDIFGFTNFKIKIIFECKINILPYFIDYNEIPFFLDKGGEEIIQMAVKENSTDFFENRKYYPGDDTRRINWKIFAHSGELHVREVEKIPPKIGKITVLFAPYSSNIYEYEYISSLFLVTINYLLKYGFTIQIISPVNNNIISIEENSEIEFNRIINNSYKPFSVDNISTNKKPVIFASFEEYSKLINRGYIEKLYSVISCFIPSSIKESLFKNIVYIKNNDGIIKDILDKAKKSIEKDEKEKQLQNIIALSDRKKIQLKIYRIDDEYFSK